MNAMRWRDIGLGLQSGVRRLHPGVWIAAALVLLARSAIRASGYRRENRLAARAA